MKSSIDIHLSRVPMVYTYNDNLASFMNVVNHKFLPHMSIPDQIICHTNKATQQVRGMDVTVSGVKMNVHSRPKSLSYKQGITLGQEYGCACRWGYRGNGELIRVRERPIIVRSAVTVKVLRELFGNKFHFYYL